MTPSQLYIQESENGKLKAEIKQMLSSQALNRHEAEELIQLTVLNELENPRKINPTEIKRIKENPNMTPNEKLDIISTLYTNNGYHIVQRDRLGIQLFRKKKFSYLSAFFWFLLLGVGLVIYILYYLLRGDHNETIIVDDNYKAKPEGIIEEPIIILPNEDEDMDESEEETESITDESDEEIENSKEIFENEEEKLDQENEESIEQMQEEVTEEIEESTQTEEEVLTQEEAIEEVNIEEELSEETQEELKKEDK